MPMTFPAFLCATVRSQPWIDASEVAIATWLRLIVRCSDDENEGVVETCRAWSERTWLAFCNVSPDGVEEMVSAKLAEWDGSNLTVFGYDTAAEAKVKKMRGYGQFGSLGAEHGKKGGRPRKDGKPPGTPPETPRGVISKPPLTSPSVPTSPTEPSVAAPPAWEKPESDEDRLARIFRPDGITWAIRREVERLHPEIGLWQPGRWAGRALVEFLAGIPEDRRTPRLAADIDRRIKAFASCEDSRTTKGGRWSVEAFCEAFNSFAAPAPPRRAPGARMMADLPAAEARPAVIPIAEARAAREVERAASTPGASDTGGPDASSARLLSETT